MSTEGKVDSMRRAAPNVVYAINAADQLIEVDEGWNDFVHHNEGPSSLLPPGILGKSLWDFLRGDSLHDIYRHLLAGIRDKGKGVEFDYRCDSPHLMRYMRMRMEPSAADGEVCFVSQTLHVIPRDHVIRVAAALRGNHHAVRCSICNLFRLPNGDWGEASQAVIECGLLNQDREPRVLWSVCQVCRNRLTSL